MSRPDDATPLEPFAAAQVLRSLRATAEGHRDVQQAKGIIRLALDLGDDEAFEVLRHYSYATNTPVRELAARLVRHAQTTSVPHERLSPLLDALEEAASRARPARSRAVAIRPDS